MLGVLLSFLSSIFWGASDFVGGVSSRKSTALHATVWSFVGATVASTLVIAVHQRPVSTPAVTAGVIAGVFGVVGFLTLYASLAAAPMGVITVIVGAGEAIVPVVVGVGWHHEPLSVLAWIGIAVALAGVTLIGLAEGASGAFSWQPLALATVSGLAFGASVVALDAAPADSGFVTPTVEVALGLVLLVLLAWGVRSVRGLKRAGDAMGITIGSEPPTRRTVGLGLLAGLFLACANLTLLEALRAGELAVVGVVLCLYPITTALLARFILDERLTAKHIVGIAVALGGCVMLAVF